MDATIAALFGSVSAKITPSVDIDTFGYICK